MNLNNNQNNCWPTSEKKLLLRAALLQGEEAIASWEQWRESVDINEIDKESYRLLPLVYNNLFTQEVIDLHTGRLKGVYRRTWCENQVLFQKLAAIVFCFQDAGIDTLLLKDAALNLRYYQDYGLRMLNSLELLVHPTDALAAMNLLHKIGWKPKGKIPTRIVPFSQSLGFENESNQFLHLRWHLFADCFSENTENEFWKFAKLTKVGDLSTYVLSPTDQLFYVCVSGGLWNRNLPIIRLADAKIIINSSQAEIDWKRLVLLAEKYRLVLPLKEMLTKLHEILNAPIPTSILQEIQNLPISTFEQREYQLMSGEKTTFLERFLMRYYQYSRTIDTAGIRLKLLGFPKYLQYVWGLPRLRDVPLQATIRGMKRLVSAKN